MSELRSPRNLTLAAVACAILIALAAWPRFVESRAEGAALDPLSEITPAPVRHDEHIRNATIAFDERILRRPDEKRDQITTRMLGAEYLQRYRETGDVDDIFRSQHEAQLSLQAQPVGNAAADSLMASSLIALHRFHDALKFETAAGSVDASNPSTAVAEASTLFEIGDYAAGKKLLGHVPDRFRDPGYETVLSRYEELTGDLDGARRNLNSAMRQIDSIYDVTAERRAWYHFRIGELDWLAGDDATAIAQEKMAISYFPQDPQALNALARFDAATHDWKDALAVSRSASLLAPLPETLGYESDAQAALGDASGSAQTRDEIFAIERIGNASHINDRLLAVYYDDHDLRLSDAYIIAKRELALRDDVYTEDAIAWAAAKVGKWDEARRASNRAMAYHTPDSRLFYHAGMIALHFGDRNTAKADLQHALALNPTFHPVYADAARATLASL